MKTILVSIIISVLAPLNSAYLYEIQQDSDIKKTEIENVDYYK